MKGRTKRRSLAEHNQWLRETNQRPLSPDDCERYKGPDIVLRYTFGAYKKGKDKK